MNWKKTLLFISTAIGTTTLAFHVINKYSTPPMNIQKKMNPITIIGNLEIYIIKKKELVLRFFLFMI